MTTSPPHNPNDPMSYLNAIEATWIAADATRVKCPTCNVRYSMLAGPGNGWLVEEHHERTCLMHEDYDQEAAE